MTTTTTTTSKDPRHVSVRLLALQRWSIAVSCTDSKVYSHDWDESWADHSKTHGVHDCVMWLVFPRSTFDLSNNGQCVRVIDQCALPYRFAFLRRQIRHFFRNLPDYQLGIERAHVQSAWERSNLSCCLVSYVSLDNLDWYSTITSIFIDMFQSGSSLSQTSADLLPLTFLSKFEHRRRRRRRRSLQMNVCREKLIRSTKIVTREFWSLADPTRSIRWEKYTRSIGSDALWPVVYAFNRSV